MAIQTLTLLGIGIIAAQELKNPLQRLTVDVAVNANTTAAAKLDLGDSSPCAWRRRRRRQLRRADRCRCRRRCDLDRNQSWHRITAQAALARLPTPCEQQAMSHPMPARDAANRLAGLQGAPRRGGPSRRNSIAADARRPTH
nr:hypothetical protein [Bradyrhizobium yuanmingense]